MAVLKTTSPVVLPFAPTETPRNTVPSSRASTAGVDTPVPRFALRRFPQMRKAGGAHENVLPLLGLNRDQFPGANINDARVDCPCFSSKTENLLHAVQARRVAHQPFSRPQGAPCEGQAIGGAMGDLDPLASRGKNDRMIADDISRAQAGYSDAAGRARPCGTRAGWHR